MPGDSTIKLTIPRQDLAEYTLFTPAPDAAGDWIRGLPVTNTITSAQLLGQAIAELNRVQLPPELRHDILEELRPSLESAAAKLAKRYLNQPLVMPAEPRQWAELGDRLVTMTCTAYTIVAVEAIKNHDSIQATNPARLTCQALHRALSFAGRKTLQAFQLYRPLQMHGWQVLHQLYSLAESQGLESLPAPEPLSDGDTIKAVYLQCLLLSCCKPNQLRQTDLAVLYRALRSWCNLVELREVDAGAALFIVDLESDQPPLYTALYQEAPGRACRYINTQPLIEHIQRHKEELSGKAGQARDDGLPEHLLDHVIASLGSMSQRNFKRSAADSALRVCLGLSSTHYHVAGRTSFERLLRGNAEVARAGDGSNPFTPSQPGRDVWHDNRSGDGLLHNEWLPGQTVVSDAAYGIDLDDRTRSELLEEVRVDLPIDERFPIYKVALTDASPGGYCLEWTEELPTDVRTGDIVGLREGQGSEWVIAVIRWLSRTGTERTLIGLELLSPRAIPYGALIHRGDGSKTPPMRVLLLPEIKLVGQPSTLMTPRASFRERQRITLASGTETRTVQLQRQIASTASYAQFEFRFIEELGDVLSRSQRGRLDTAFDSLWSNI